MPCTTPLEEDSKARTGPLQTWHHASFPFADLSLYPFAATKRISWVMDQVTEHGSKPRDFSLILGQRGREKEDKNYTIDFLK